MLQAKDARFFGFQVNIKLRTIKWFQQYGGATGRAIPETITLLEQTLGDLIITILVSANFSANDFDYVKLLFLESVVWLTSWNQNSMFYWRDKVDYFYIQAMLSIVFANLSNDVAINSFPTSSGRRFLVFRFQFSLRFTTRSWTWKTS